LISVLQCVAVCCSVLQCVAACCFVQDSFICHESYERRCNTLQHTATHCNTLQHTTTHCNTLQHTATHCNTLQHTTTHCSTLQHTAAHYNTLQHTTTHCNTLQHPATHCNTLQHTALCMIHSYVMNPTNGGYRTSNNYDCQIFQQVFTGVPVHIKYVFSGAPKNSNRFSCE